MKRTNKKLIIIQACFFLLLSVSSAFGWHDKTHMAISKAAEYDCWYNSAGADITKNKAGDKEATNHWFNNTDGIDVTDKMVLDQAAKYNDPNDAEGHLYGAIIASLRDYIKNRQANKYAEYDMAFCSHYIGDLSMPFHNIPYGDTSKIGIFNKNHHTINDGIVEFSVLNNVGLIQKNLYGIQIHNENDLAQEIARIANLSRRLALTLEKENRDMTSDEAYTQLSHSASLLKAALSYAKEQKAH
ncbi:MAG: hypothetical protein LUO89_09910 [Methanothrix sp.]|nr:hypothetical protein [Methanothrix sp.]